MEFAFEARVVLELEHKPGWETSKHVSTKFNLEVIGDLDVDAYIEDSVLNKTGSKVFTDVLIQGLVGNIHMAKDQGFRDDAQHLRYIIAELEKGFIAIAETGAGEF